MSRISRVHVVPVAAAILVLLVSLAAPATAAKPAPNSCKRCTTSPSVAFVTPSTGATLSGTITATGSSSDPNGISTVAVSVDGGSWTTASGTTSWSAPVNTAGYANGAHTLEARATDAAGNASTAMLSVTINNGDTTAPSVSIAAPAAGATLAGTVSVAGGATDNVSVAAVAVQVDGGAWTTATGIGSWSWSWDTTGVANGSHTLTARATDSAGNTKTTSESVTVSNTAADTTAPTIAMTAPAAGATVGGSVTVTGTSSDNVGVSSVAVQVDGGAWQQASGATSWSWAWNSTGVSNGSHVITARAADAAGNVATATVTVNVANSTVAPSTQGSWTSPEGVHINVNTAGAWTISQIYSILTANALDLSRVGPHLTINVQDTYSSQTVVSACCSGNYSSIVETMWLQGVNSGFSARPDDALTHEYGHAWSWYWNYAAHNGDWLAYEQARWTTSDGSLTLATDTRTGSSYTWQIPEIVADDYRLLFGDASAVSERPTHLNTSIPDPRNVPGLMNFLDTQWRTA